MSATYQLRIELVGGDPTIWRTVIVPSATPFDHLHDIIKIVMGWKHDHPYEFVIDKTTVRDFGPELDMGDNPFDRDAMDAELAELVTMVKTKFTYRFHECWEHRITVEEILTSEKDPVYAVCLGGDGACPPEQCSGISNYQDMLGILADDKHPKHKKIRKELRNLSPFNKDEVNAALRHYFMEWEEIYEEVENITDDPEGDGEYDEIESDVSEYERLKQLVSPRDLSNDKLSKEQMDSWIDAALVNKDSEESKALTRLVSEGRTEEQGRAMIFEALSIEWFYDLKYGTVDFDGRYIENLSQLPDNPKEITSLDCAIEVINTTTKGIPFAAIECLHNDISAEATNAILKGLKNFSDHQYCWEDCQSTPIWYSLAAEGHLTEELIDVVIDFYDEENFHQTDWILEQGEYLIGKLAQKYPDQAAQKVLAAMEKSVEEETDRGVYFLFDVFSFCDIDLYKDRLMALLRRDDIFWHDMLASTMAHLQIKEALPVLKEQLKRLEAKKSNSDSRHQQHAVEIREAVEQLESGEDLHPDVNTPLCLRRGTWREAFADAEKYFYDDESISMEDFDPGLTEFFNQQQPIIKTNKTGRNDPCPCGSGKKYKKCCLDKDLIEGLER